VHHEFPNLQVAEISLLEEYHAQQNITTAVLLYIGKAGPGCVSSAYSLGERTDSLTYSAGIMRGAWYWERMTLTTTTNLSVRPRPVDRITHSLSTARACGKSTSMCCETATDISTGSDDHGDHEPRRRDLAPSPPDLDHHFRHAHGQTKHTNFSSTRHATRRPAGPQGRSRTERYTCSLLLIIIAAVILDGAMRVGATYISDYLDRLHDAHRTTVRGDRHWQRQQTRLAWLLQLGNVLMTRRRGVHRFHVQARVIRQQRKRQHRRHIYLRPARIRGKTRQQQTQRQRRTRTDPYSEFRICVLTLPPRDHLDGHSHDSNDDTSTLHDAATNKDDDTRTYPPLRGGGNIPMDQAVGEIMHERYIEDRDAAAAAAAAATAAATLVDGWPRRF
jgi:hypothetical protein